MATSDLEKQPLLDAEHNTVSAGSDDQTPDPTLHELQQNVFKAQRAYMRAWSRTTSGKWQKRIMFSVTGLLLFIMISCMAMITADALAEDDMVYHSGKVQLDAFIMSKCPDAKDCLHDMILPAMQQIGHKVDFKLNYIGSVTDHDDGVSCMHGQSECLGNILELCAARLYPDPMIYLGFTMCMTNSYSEIASQELVEECALEHGMSFKKLNDCANAEDGSMSVELLRSSFNRTQSLGVTTSCTVMVDESVFAIRDGGKWTEHRNGTTAEDLVKEVNRLYQPPSYAVGDW